ncbi:transposase [Nonomuraea sp. bgisy101]|uniref:transposase n=1 Tax=Nonomuraea sp. bgisy101 TaxID=3413784 RepID=UPI003D72A8C0
MPVWEGPGGYEIEPIKLNGRSRLRISRRAPTGVLFFVAYVAEVDELRRFVDLADLVEVVDIRARRRSCKRSTAQR